ncbi:unnamed protein product [Moneuplotes crassus]|uniref:Uncharacterized protein n=1 Tax=Euplotes crassus TaxID=5936 RepID=A0AAD2CW79_EUPCR|nr:unnamed protein product [Moneuplotes crassus]
MFLCRAFSTKKGTVLNCIKHSNRKISKTGMTRNFNFRMHQSRKIAFSMSLRRFSVFNKQNISIEDQLRSTQNKEQLLSWMDRNNEEVPIDIRCEALEKYVGFYSPNDKIPQEVHDFIKVEPKIPLHLYSLIDSFTKLNIVENPKTNKSVWTLVEYFICRTKFCESIDDIPMLAIIFKGFSSVATLESISIEEVYESLEPTLISLIKSEFSSENSAVSSTKVVMALSEILSCFIINLEGSSEVHYHLMKVLYDHITELGLAQLCNVLHALAYKKIYFKDTRTREEQEIETRLVNETNVQLVKHFIKETSLADQELVSKNLKKNIDRLLTHPSTQRDGSSQSLRTVLDGYQKHRLEWALNVLFE